MKTSIIVNLQIEALHNWPEAAEFESQMAFLALDHRHMFHIKAKKAVTHSDRDVEIIVFKRKIIAYLRSEFYSTKEDILLFGRMSCEEIATELMNKFDLEYCEVLEDGENGACVEK